VHSPGFDQGDLEEWWLFHFEIITKKCSNFIFLNLYSFYENLLNYHSQWLNFIVNILNYNIKKFQANIFSLSMKNINSNFGKFAVFFSNIFHLLFACQKFDRSQLFTVLLDNNEICLKLKNLDFPSFSIEQNFHIMYTFWNMSV